MADAQPRMLAVFAHPDDETFLAGPLLARCASEGVQVDLLCATPPPGRPERRRALREAASLLGIRHVRLLAYEPSPMWPLPDSDEDPTWLSIAPLEEIAEAVGESIRKLKPDVVVTDSPYGAYGHPDHIRMHDAAVLAFDRHAGPGARLYCLAFPLPLVRLNAALMSLLRHDTSAVGPRGACDLRAIVRGAPEKTTVIDVRQHVIARRRAAAAYAEEIAAAPLPLKLLEKSPLWVQERVFGRAALTRLRPPAESSDTKETALFSASV